MRTLVIAAVLLSATLSLAKEYHVALDGDDANPGTRERPLASLQRAADKMAPGDVCLVREGVYRQPVTVKRGGREGKPLRFVAFPGEVVTLSGTERVRGRWERYRDHIYRVRVDREFQQLFVDGRMMVEARWPNATFEQMLDRSRWAHAVSGSHYGLLRDPELAKTGINWTGALATLNVTHQFYTWTRRVTHHEAGADVFEYPRDFGPATEMRYGKRAGAWQDDRYYLSGKLEALDAPGEWHLDRKGKMLYLWAPAGDSPASHRVEMKVRDFAFAAEDVDYVEVQGLHFFAATFSFNRCNHCLIDGCHLLFPTYAREIAELNPPPNRHASPRTQISGDYNVVRNSSLAYTPLAGLIMTGRQNVAENNLIHDVCWTGSLHFAAIGMGPGPSTSTAPPGGIVRGNTVYRCGNAIINYRGQPYVIERNHVHDGGMACKDVALVYTGQPTCAGSEVRYNWVHGCWTEGGNGLGIRGDDQTRKLTVHHNVVWDCGRDGIIVKGDNNRVVNNTCLFIGTRKRLGNFICLPVRAEPKKPWRKQHPLLPVQNRNSLIANNAARTITGDQTARSPFPFGQCLSHNYLGENLKLIAPNQWDFRPQPNSPLIDAGTVVPDLAERFAGRSPDIGAYEFGGEQWKPGHHNGVRVFDDGTGNVRIALAMPIRESATLKVSRPGGRAATVRFTPADWMHVQTVNVAGSGEIAVDSPWGRVRVPRSKTTAWFPEPDLGKPQPLDTRFNTWVSETEAWRESVLTRWRKAVQSGESANLLRHGDFESEDLSPWRRTSNSRKTPAAMEAERVRQGKDGGWCVRLKCEDAELMREGVLKWIHPLPAELKPGVYVLAFDMRVQDLRARGQSGMFCSYIRTSTGKGSGANAGQMENAFFGHAAEWTRRECVIQVPSGHRPSFVSLQLHRATGTVWLDNVGLWRAPEAP